MTMLTIGVPMGRARCRADRGSATVLVVAAMATLLALGAGALSLVGAVGASHEAHAAADLAALAGAVLLVRGEAAGAACARASRVAAQNGARLVTCRPFGDDALEVVVHAPVVGGVKGVGGDAVARSRAGPSPDKG
ncbi:MAG: Rv3654c family TadE-like protein [Lapillicoccus sp.]